MYQSGPMLCIELYEGEAFDVHDRLPSFIRATLLGAVQRFWEKCRIYAADGSVWRPQPSGFRGFSFPTRVLIESGWYNPIRPFAMSYEEIGRYEFARLKTLLGDTLYAGRRGYLEYPETVAELSAAVVHVLDAGNFQELARRARDYSVAWPAQRIPSWADSGRPP